MTKDILKREVDRKEFLVILSGLALAITGVSGIVKSASGALSGNQQKVQKTFGNGAYGA